jgi:hypothetical protein
MWLKSLYQVTFYNTIVELFNFEMTTSSKVQYLDHPKEYKKVIVKYEYKVESEIYKNEITANKEAFSKKVGIKEFQIVYYNRLMPNVSYLENWKLDTYYNLTFVLFSIFLSLILYFHLRVDKEKWIIRYKKAFGS